MSVTTQSSQAINTTKLDEGFAKQLESMLGGVSAGRLTPASIIERDVQPGLVSLAEVLPQANDGISLAQIIDVTLQQAAEQLAQAYYSLEGAMQGPQTSFVEMHNLARQQLDKVADLFAQTCFQGQAVFHSSQQWQSTRKVPTGVDADDYITLQIPNTAMNQLGGASWQLTDGPIMPRRLGDKLVFNCNNLRLQQGQRIHLTVGDADILEECIVDVNTTLETISTLINQAQLDWLNQAVVADNHLSVTAIGVEQSRLVVESQSVAVEDSLAALEVKDGHSAQQAMNSIIGAINMLADYRDIAVSVANDLHSAINNLLNAPLHQVQAQDMTAPLAGAMVKDVQKMFEQQSAVAMLAQANIED